MQGLWPLALWGHGQSMGGLLEIDLKLLAQKRCVRAHERRRGREKKKIRQDRTAPSLSLSLSR